ncbi:hypothetical protein E4U26_002322 [Claviceps purpurea]|nr:hypothetical protein E4U26_002322 [Claviceps purpurea]
MRSGKAARDSTQPCSPESLRPRDGPIDATNFTSHDSREASSDTTWSDNNNTSKCNNKQQ